MEPLKLQLTPVQSEILKSVALLLLLCHHLFYIPTNLFEDFSVAGIHDIVNKTAMACKACVPFFVFLSGYGLAASAEQTGIVDIKRFFMRRFTKLYLNYWLVWLIFVPVGVLFFGISFESVYGHEHTAAGLVADFLWLLNITGAYGYNPTWWFYSCIILLYVLFPFIFVLCRKPIAVHLMFWGSIALTFCPLVWLQPIRYYILAFLLGIYFRNGLMASIPPCNKLINKIIHKSLSKWETIALGMIMVAAFPLRMLMPPALVFDTATAILIVLLFHNINLHPALAKSMAFLGQHSFNIFLFHTFIYFLYLPQIVYWHRNPVVVFITLLLICITISSSIEYLKRIIYFQQLSLFITNKFSK